MKLKKIIYIALTLALLPFTSAAEEYPYLPTGLKQQVISFFDINTAGKTMLYEKVNIFEDLDAWMIGWFDNQTKIITGITDTEDIIYYSISHFDNSSPVHSGKEISTSEGEKKAIEFLNRIMPAAELKLLDANSYEYIFADSYNSIPILGREATVVVDKSSGEVIFYKGFGQTDCKFELLQQLVSPEHAFELFYENIGMELVYNTVFDDAARTKAVRPMYILNRSNLTAIDAQTGAVCDISMYDYNYYYNNDFYDPRYYYDNNIRTEEKIFTPDGSVSASGYDLSAFLDTPYLKLSDGYSAKIVPGKLNYYSNGDGSENVRSSLQIDIVPMNHSINIFTFSDKFDSGNVEWFNTITCDTPYVFARAYVDASTGELLDFESVRNINWQPEQSQKFSIDVIDSFLLEKEDLKYYNMLQTGDNTYHVSYARYVDGVRVIGEGASIIYDSSLGAVTDYTLSVSDTDFLHVSFMKTHDQMKELVKKELPLGRYYVDKSENSKHVVYDAINKHIAFDPVTGHRTDRLSDSVLPVIATCSVGSNIYTLSGAPFTAPSPIISSDRLFFPVSLISALLGYDISHAESGLTLSGNKDVIRLTEGSASCVINGNALVLDLPPVSISGNMYVSAGSLRNLFGMFVRWDTQTNKIHIIN